MRERSRLKSHADGYGVSGYAHLRDLLDKEQPDLIALCTPSGMHPEETILAARRNATLQLWDFAEPRDYDAQVKAANYETTSVYGFGHPLYYKNVIDTLRGEAEPETDGREGLKSLEVLIAAYLSARDGRTVSLPLEY